MSIVDRLTGGPDPARVLEEMLALKEPERRKRAKAAEINFEKVAWRGLEGRRGRQWRAAAYAWIGTATARTIAANFWRIGAELDDDARFADDVYAVLAARGRAFFETLARGLLRNEGPWPAWPLVRRAVREGLIEPADGDDYVRGMVFGVARGRAAMNELDSTYKGLLADPQLLERELWQLFEVDLGNELSHANVFHKTEDDAKPYPLFTRGENRWLYALTRLAAEGRVDRDRLLDASLDALVRDFRASSVGWYAQLHEELEPTRAERLERLDRYLALVTSPAPVVVKAGLAALRTIEDDVPPEAFAHVAPTPFTQRQKNLATETLSLLARFCKRHPESRAELLEAAAHALAHERADVQERALKLLEQYADEAPRAALLAYVESVSPTLRPRVEALTGFAAPEEEAIEIEIREPVQPRPTPELVRRVRAPLEPVASVDELIELAAMLVEGNGDGDDCERFLDGLSRLCDERPAGFERRTAGLVKRAADAGVAGAVAAGTNVIAYLVHAWTRHDRPRAVFTYSRTVIGFLARRAEEVGKRAVRGNTRPLLALPTHSGGWIDPDVLSARIRDRSFGRPEHHDRVQARMRAFPDIGPVAYERRIETRELWGHVERDLRLVCGALPPELEELGPPVAQAGAVEEDRRTWYGEIGWAGLDALGVRWAVTALPSLPQVAFAGAARAAVDAREGSSYHHPEAVLEHALDPHVPLGAEAWLAIAACLVAKSPDLPRVAVDLIVAAVEDGRFDGEALGEAIAWLADNELAKLNRLEAPLRDAVRVSPLHAAHVARAIEAALGDLRTRPHGLHALLEVAVETRRPIADERARAALERVAADVSRTSKLGKLARSLVS